MPIVQNCLQTLGATLNYFEMHTVNTVNTGLLLIFNFPSDFISILIFDKKRPNSGHLSVLYTSNPLCVRVCMFICVSVNV